jgi:hypothetical protein
LANKRIFYAVQQVAIAPVGTTGAGSFTSAYTLHGLQSVGINTRFNLEQAFEIGQISIYENIENLPDIEVTLEKVLDGYPLIYHQATRGAPSASLSGRANVKSTVALSIFTDTQDSASGNPISECIMSGMFVSAWNLNVQVEGNATESLTLVGNNKIWHTDAGATFFTGQFNNTDTPFSPQGVNRRQDILFGTGVWPTACDLPGGVGGVDGITGGGKNVLDAVTGDFGAHIQSIKISTNLGREQMNELGRRGPYHRYINFPVEVRCDIECYSTRGDLVEATEAGVLSDGNNLADKTIRIAMIEGTKVDLGTKNKLQTTTYGGANAGGRGGNATVTYSYTNFNDCTVQHSGDPTVTLRL